MPIYLFREVLSPLCLSLCLLLLVTLLPCVSHRNLYPIWRVAIGVVTVQRQTVLTTVRTVVREQCMATLAWVWFFLSFFLSFLRSLLNYSHPPIVAPLPFLTSFAPLPFFKLVAPLPSQHVTLHFIILRQCASSDQQ